MRSTVRGILLKFLNLVAEDLKIEELKSISEVQYFIPILIKLTKTGCLEFVSHDETKNFTNAVEFIKEEMGEFYVECLCPDQADSGNEDEVANILLALLYMFRIKQASKFVEFCDRLDASDNSSVANLIEKLDNIGHFSSIPFHTIFSPSSTPEDVDKENSESIEKKNNKNSGSSHPSPLSPISTPIGITKVYCTRSVGNIGTPFRHHSKIAAPRHATERKRQHIRMAGFEISPVNKVLGSPRGEDVSHIYALRQDVKRLRDLGNMLGREKDQLDEQCQSQCREIEELKRQISSLEGLVSRLQPQAERVSSLEDRILAIEAENTQLSKSLITERNKHLKLESKCQELMFQRDEARQQVDLRDDEMDYLKTEYEKALRRADDELQMHEHSRRRLLDSERKWTIKFTTLRAELSAKDEALNDERRAKSGHEEKKEHEEAERALMFSQCREHFEERNRQLRDELDDKCKQVIELEELCAKREARISELEPVVMEHFLKQNRESCCSSQMESSSRAHDCKSLNSLESGATRKSKKSRIRRFFSSAKFSTSSTSTNINKVAPECNVNKAAECDDEKLLDMIINLGNRIDDQRAEPPTSTSKSDHQQS